MACSVAVRAAARGDDATACEAWLLAGESAAAADVQRAEAISLGRWHWPKAEDW